MMRFRLMALGVCLATPIYLCTAVSAQDAPKKTDLNELLCKDIMRMSGEDRSIALAALHGFALGKKGQTEFVVSDLTRISDEYTEYCLDHPQEKALEAFAKFTP